MSAERGPRALLVTSAGSSAGAVTPVLAELEAAGFELRAIDVGRAGARTEGALDWVLRTFAGELAERRLMRELSANPPDVAITFDPATAMAMSLARDQAPRPAPVVAVVNELAPAAEWADAGADRYLAPDDEAAVALADHGVEGERILTIGAICERAFVEAAQSDRRSLRARFRIASDAPVVVVDVAGLGADMTSQVAFQLSLLSAGGATFLFDAGGDVEAAAALRQQVPALELRAKLFGQTDDAPLLWRCADVVVARPTEIAVARALALGARLVSFLPEGRAGEALAGGLEIRRMGTSAANPLLLSSALEPLLRARPRTDPLIGADGAANAADIAWVVATERRDILEERRRAEQAGTRARVAAAASAAESAARMASAAGGLEDLGGDVSPTGAASADVPDAADIARLRAEVSTRMSQVSRTVAEARETAERWDRRLAEARKQGDTARANEAGRAADAERARMHAALAEMAELHTELERLEKAAAAAPPPRPRTSSGPGASQGSRARTAGSAAGAASPPPRSTAGAASSPPRSTAGGIDDMIAEMKRKSVQQQATIDDELAALKRKMNSQKKR